MIFIKKGKYHNKWKSFITKKIYINIYIIKKKLKKSFLRRGSEKRRRE